MKTYIRRWFSHTYIDGGGGGWWIGALGVFSPWFLRPKYFHRRFFLLIVKNGDRRLCSCVYRLLLFLALVLIIGDVTVEFLLRVYKNVRETIRSIRFVVRRAQVSANILKVVEDRSANKHPR